MMSLVLLSSSGAQQAVDTVVKLAVVFDIPYSGISWNDADCRGAEKPGAGCLVDVGG